MQERLGLFLADTTGWADERLRYFFFFNGPPRASPSDFALGRPEAAVADPEASLCGLGAAVEDSVVSSVVVVLFIADVSSVVFGECD